MRFFAFSLLALSTSLFAEAKKWPKNQDLFYANGEFFFEEAVALEENTKKPNSNEASEEDCGFSLPPYRATVRHIEGKGIGYTKGYTSVDLFLASNAFFKANWVPFLDARLHVFNSGAIAANTGFGLRYIAPSFVYGINAYYDYRQTSHQNYNQVGVGFEALGKVWDFRLNGYLPFGAKESAYYNTQFSYFSGHSVYLQRTRQFAMKGLNAEAGIHIKKMQKMQFYGGFGPYYFENQGKNAIGGKIRAWGSFFDYIKAEVSTSYDSVFHWIGQGELSFVFAFGPKKKVERRQGRACSKELRLKERALQGVERYEILVLTDQTQYPLAINPHTGLPYRFIFVNNMSHSQGTFESPYPTLAQAQQNSVPFDTLYVFSGDGTTTGMDQGITLQPNQTLWGSGVAQSLNTSLGTIVIPAFSTTLPNLTTTVTNGSVVTLANNNEVAGVAIVGSTPVLGITSPNGSFVVGSYLHDNVINLTNTQQVITGINLVGQQSAQIIGNTISVVGNGNYGGGFGPSGITVSPYASSTLPFTVTIANNTIQATNLANGGNPTSQGIYLATANAATLNVTITHNAISTFAHQNNPAATPLGILAFPGRSGIVNATIDHNDIRAGMSFDAQGVPNQAGHAIEIHPIQGASFNGIITNNSCFATSFGCRLFSAAGGAQNPMNLTVVNNWIGGNPQTEGIFIGSGNGALCAELILNQAEPSITLEQTGSSSFKLDPLSIGNVPTPTLTGTITSGSCNSLYPEED